MITNLFVLCEGQTEEYFVKNTLHDYLQGFGINVIARIVGNSRKGKGGIAKYADVLRDIKVMLTSNKDSKGYKCHFTTMFDYYALPQDFPGKKDASAITDTYPLIAHIEKLFAEDIENKYRSTIIPHIQLHEFESLVFAGLDELRFLKPEGPKTEKAINLLKDELRKCGGNPELVNNCYHTAPSRRLENAFCEFAKYSKIVDGNETVELVTIPKLKRKCKHFGEWINKLEELGNAEYV